MNQTEFECWHCGHTFTVIIHDLTVNVEFCPCCGSELEIEESEDEEDDEN